MTIATIMPQLQRAQAMLQAGQAAQAWMLMAPLRQAIDRDGQALRLYALAGQSAGRIDEAASALARIAVLENEPPEILGALADMLGTAGRHDEALVYWDRLAERQPQVADAHLNRAVTAANAGLHDRAIDAAGTGLKRFPGHPRLLATLAMALKNAGRIDESLDAFDRAVAADPARALTRHNQAVALRAACRFEEACAAFEASETLGMTGAQFHANWAAAALEAEQVDKAAEEYRRALSEDPTHRESLRGLTRLQIEYRGGADAFDHFERAVEARADVTSWVEWADALAANNRLGEILDVTDRALRAHPGEIALRSRHAYAKGMTGDAAEGLAELEALAAGQPDFGWALHSIPSVALRAGRPERAAEILERQVEAEPGDQIAWSLLSIAWRLLGDPREQWLCDYDRLVMVTDVPSPDGSMAPADYALEVAAALDPLHRTTAAPGDQTLRGGTQTSGELFARPEPAIRRFREAVLLAAQRAVAGLPDDPAHPFLGRKSERLGFAGSWSVRLSGGGHHVPHMHHQGWMSSAYYARLPVIDDGARARHEGWIQFGAPPESFGLDLEPRRLIEPAPGRLVLFPSYMWHGTIPFASGDRLTAAFDYRPV